MIRPAAALVLAATLLPAQPAPVRTVRVPSTTGGNRHYAGNREPLLPSPLIRLPLGAVQARGWLRRQLELMAEGFTGPPTLVSDGSEETRFNFDGRRGSREWIEYHYAWPRRFSSAEVAWSERPESWRIVWWDGKAWQPVKGEHGPDRVTFEAVESTRLRLVVQMRERGGAAISEWRVE